jgi:FMN-dependent NADH-azoreductase
MMNILHVSCSPRGRASESHRLSQEVIAHLLKSRPAAKVVERLLGEGALLRIDEDYALSQQSSADASKAGTAATSEELIKELEQSDCLVIATPMHNYTVPAALKLWIDHVARVRRTFDVGPNGKVGLLCDRPVFVAVASGGRFSGEGSRQPDFLTPYLKAILGMIGLRDVSFFCVEGVASGPAAVAGARAQARLALQHHFADGLRGSAPSR